MEDDMWRADGSFRGIAGSGGGGGGKGGGGKSGGGPQFNRVIPKFLQKFHQGPVGPAISTKFQLPPQDDDGDGELDDVQKAALEEYMEKDQSKKDAIAKAAGADPKDERAAEKKEVKEKDVKPTKAKTQRMAELGKEDTQRKKRKRKPTGEALKNKKLLSFSMDDEE